MSLGPPKRAAFLSVGRWELAMELLTQFFIKNGYDILRVDGVATTVKGKAFLSQRPGFKVSLWSGRATAPQDGYWNCKKIEGNTFCRILGSAFWVMFLFRAYFYRQFFEQKSLEKTTLHSSTFIVLGLGFIFAACAAYTWGEHCTTARCTRPILRRLFASCTFPPDSRAVISLTLMWEQIEVYSWRKISKIYP